MNEIKNGNEFQEIIKSNKYVVVDFYALWCGPCRLLSPVMDEISWNFSEIKFIKVNVDTNQDLSSKLAITSIPAVFFYKNGNVVDSFVGYRPKEEILKFIDKNKF